MQSSVSVTNRDLCLAIYGLTDRPETDSRSLEEYLRALWKIARDFQEYSLLSSGLFIDLLDASLTVEPLGFDEVWRASYRSETEIDGLKGYLHFEATLQNQIAELREFLDTGGLPIDFYDSRDLRGWENIYVASFLEHGTVGKFRYWNAPDEVVPLEPLTWEMFADFLVYCQCYE
jgi:hypothetical protein